MAGLDPLGANSSVELAVIAGLDPAIQEPSIVERARFVQRLSRLDGRIKSGHDGQRVSKPAFALKLASMGLDLIYWEIPRLCRGGSRSLTFPAVCAPQLAVIEKADAWRRAY